MLIAQNYRIKIFNERKVDYFQNIKIWRNYDIAFLNKNKTQNQSIKSKQNEIN